MVGLYGVDAPGQVIVRIASLNLSIDDNASPVMLSGGDIDLGDEESEWMVATFDLHDGAESVVFELGFHRDGQIEIDGEMRPLDLSGPPVSFVADAASVRERKHILIEINLAGSIVEGDESVFLLPDFRVRY